MRYAAYALLLLLYVLHTDVWYWDDPRLMLGLPVGVTYHVLWTLAVMVAFGLLVGFAWPQQLEAVDSPPGARDRDAAPAGSDVVDGKPAP